MAQRKKFKDLNLNNAFLFAAVLADAEICRMILEIILGRDLPKVNVSSEHTILFSYDYRSVRLDVYASDEMKVGYNIEMENTGNDLPKRSRFHQAEMDVTALQPGMTFGDLKPTYVIFICTFDPFGDGLYRYTFEERCLETGKELGDETRKIFLNTKGENPQNLPEILVHFLKYVEASNDECVRETGDADLSKLHDRIKKIKESRETEGRYMRFEELLKIRGEEEAELKTISYVRRMKERGMDSAKTAELLGEDADYIWKIFNILLQNPDQDNEWILEELYGRKLI